MEAGLKTYGQAIADVMAYQIDEGAELPMTVDEWHTFVEKSSFVEVRGQGARAWASTSSGTAISPDA